MKNYVQSSDTLDLAAPYDRSAGQGALVGTVFGVALNDLVSGATGPFSTKGVFDLTKKSGDTPAQGALVYWDDTNKYVTTTATSNTLIGAAVVAALSGDATVRVALGKGRAAEAGS